MTDYFAVFLAGISTGCGVIIAQKLIAFLERHPIVIMFKHHAKELTGYEEEKVKRRPR